MIRSYNGVRLLSSHLIRDSCKSIYEGVFHRTLDYGVWTLSRVFRGGVGRLGVINHNNQVLPNTSIRGLASLSRDDDDDDDEYDDEYVIDDEGMTEEERFQRTEADFQRGFKDYCKKRGKTFSSEEDKLNMYKWFCKHFIYGREYPRRRVFLGPRYHTRRYQRCGNGK